MKYHIVFACLLIAYSISVQCMNVQMQQVGQPQNQNQNLDQDIEREGGEPLLEPDGRIEVCGARDLSCVAMTGCSLVMIALIVSVVSQAGDYEYTSSGS